MRRALAIIVACGLGAATVGEARQQPSSPGLIVEAIEKGSAPDLAGLKAGDELVSWTRSAGSASADASGAFRSPFDAREFDLEQLPRGGTVLSAARDGHPVGARLIPGFWGVTVRPVFSGADLSVYEAGKAQLTEHPSEALTTWQPLIDRLQAAGDRGSAAWLMTRVATALVAKEELQPADRLFETAAALFKEPANPSFEAMVWEGKGLAYCPEFSRRPVDSTGEKPPKLIAALEAHERARSLRIAASRGVRTLSIVESELMAVHTVLGASVYFFAATRDDGPVTFRQSEQFFKQAIDTVTNLAPGSFAHARVILRMSNFVNIGYGPAPWGSSKYATRALTDAARRPYLLQAWAIYETVAPTHVLLRSVLLALNVATYLNDAPAEYETLQRRLMLFGEQTGDRALLEGASMSLARAMVKRGAISEALALRDELIRNGSSYSSLAAGLVTLASDLNSRGHRGVAVSVLESIVDGTSPPHVRAALNLAAYRGTDGDRVAAERTLSSILSRPDSTRLSLDQRLEILDALAFNAVNTRDYVAAEAWAERALNEAKAVPNSDLAVRYDSLASVARWSHDFDKTTEYRNLAIEQGRLIKNPTDAQLSLQANRLQEASPASPETEAAFAEELARIRKTNPGTSREAAELSRIAFSQNARGNLEGAERSLLGELTLRRRLQPGSDGLIGVLNNLGFNAKRRGDNQTALGYYEEALGLWEGRRLGSSNPLGASAAEGIETPAEPYVKVVGMLLARGDITGAFNVSERARARSLLAMMRTRDQRDTTSLPPGLYDKRRRLETEYDAKQSQLQGLSTVKNAVAVAVALEDLNKLWLQLKDLDRQVAELNPRAAALEQPAPVSLADVRARLDRGTVLLSYLTGSSVTYLFVVTTVADTEPGGSGVVAYPLPVTNSQLRASISAFRTLIGWDEDPNDSNRGLLLDRARALYDALVRPAQSQIARAERVLLSVDGALQALPFGALVRDVQGRPQFLTEWKPLHTIPSMSVYLETLGHRRSSADEGKLAAFGDPVYVSVQPMAAQADAEVTSVLRAGGTLARLPGTRREVSAIAALFGPRATTYLGASSTETQARALDESVRFIHFAVHGVLDEKRPMNSALMFATPARSTNEDNGVLQAWEIFRYMRIDADLVTLSACDSGLGKEVAGEGLIGLTRAFLAAGARTVAASLWKVADGPTAELMTHFYANLSIGQAKDRALRNAQLALIHLGRQPGARVDYSSPKYWAAFTLTGDWK